MGSAHPGRHRRASAPRRRPSKRARIASPDGDLVFPARSIVSLGPRFRFKVGDAPATLRVQVANIFDNHGYANGTSGFHVFNQPRRISMTLAADV